MHYARFCSNITVRTEVTIAPFFVWLFEER